MSPSTLYESAFNKSSVGTCLLTASTDPTILAVNDVFIQYASRSRHDFVGKRLFEVFPDPSPDSADGGSQALRNSLAKLLETGEAQAMPMQRYPIEVRQENGELAFEERYWSARNTPIFDDGNVLICIEHTTADITDRILAEKALLESEGRLRAYIMATADVVYRMSPDWKYMDSLEGRGFLKTTKKWAEWRMEEYVHPDELERGRAAIEKAIREKGVFELEHRVLRADGSYGWTYSRAAPRLDANGEIFEWIGAASDITKRKLVEEQLKESERRKDEFLAMLAHELRNPLAPISSAAELLRIAAFDRNRVLQTSEIITRQIRHLTSLVDDLMDVSRVSRGLVKLDNMPLDIRQVVAEAVEQVTPLVEGKRHHLRVDLAPGITVSGDRKRLVQVLTNLLNNAAKYTPEGGELEVHAKAHDNNVVVSVMDNGIGIESDLVHRVFDLFSQAEVTSDRTSGGLGLGLALVKNLVELHKGTVKCESDGPGEGSKFTVFLPRLNSPAQPETSSDTRQSQPIEARSLRFLVVDDNVDGALTLAMFLQASGHRALVVHHPADALARAETEAFDVCILDIGLPEIDGNELSRRLRQKAGTAGSVMIALTGYGQEQDRRQTREAGFALHLVKPLDTSQLLEFLGESFNSNFS